MKTTARALAAIGVWVLSGVISATGSEKTAVASKMVKSAELEVTAIPVGLILGVTSESVDYQKEAQLITRALADREEAKAIQMIMSGRESQSRVKSDLILGDEEVDDYDLEASSILKSWADEAEVRAINKLVFEGKIKIFR
jgi:hypothetical protein